MNNKAKRYKNSAFHKQVDELEKKYKKKVIIYLDILGIKDFTNKASDYELCELYCLLKNIADSFSADSFSKDNVLKRFLGEYSQLKIEDLDFSISILSDSIIISFSKKFLFLLPDFLRITRFLQIILIYNGLLARGAVTCNKIYHTKNDTTMVFGKGLVEAYMLETQGDSPIVQIKTELWNEYKRMIEKKGKLQSIFKENCNIEDSSEKGLIFAEKVVFYKSEEVFIIDNSTNKIYYNHFCDLKDTLNLISDKRFLGKTNIIKFSSIVNKNIEKYENLSKTSDCEKQEEFKKIVKKWKKTKQLIEYALNKEKSSDDVEILNADNQTL